MSWQATAYVKSLTISPTGHKINRGEKLILLLLADYIDPNTGIAWPSIRSLADDGIYEKQQVLRIITSLERKGFISVLKGHGRCPNRYSIIGLSTKCHQKSKSGFGDISKSFGDISKTFGDIAMSPEPHTEPIVQPHLITTDPSMFDEAYKAYPKHIGKTAAEKAWIKALQRNKIHPSAIYIKIQEYALSCKDKDKQFIPHMATWLNQDRFTDDPKDWVESNGNGQTSKAERRSARISETTKRVFDPASHIHGYNSKGLPDGTT